MQKLRFLTAAALTVVMLMAIPVSCHNTHKSDDSDSSDVSAIIFEAQIREKMPTYRFELSKREAAEGDRFFCGLSIYDPTADTDDPKGKRIQLFSFMTSVTDMDNPTQLVDMNFDGSLDLVINTAQGAGSTGQYEVYLWHESNNLTNFMGFLPTPEMVYSGSVLETYQDGTKQLIVTEQLTAEQSLRTLYQVEKVDGYQRSFIRMLRRELTSFNQSTGKTEIAVSELLDGSWVTIYSDENAADGNPAENFLRFGVAEPISIEQAEWLAGAKYDGCFIKYNQLRTVGGKTYFEIFVSEPFNCYFDQYCGVAADGSEIVVLTIR